MKNQEKNYQKIIEQAVTNGLGYPNNLLNDSHREFKEIHKIPDTKRM